MSSEPSTTKRAPKRSPNYPYIGLADAVQKAKSILNANDDHWASLPGIAQALGYSESSSSLGKVVGALAQFGLITEEGRGNDRKVKVSNRYLDLHHYPAASQKHRDALKAAAISPPLHKELLSKYHGVLPPKDDAIRIYLLREREGGVFNRSTVDLFLSQFRATLKFAGLEGTAIIDKGEGDDPTTTVQVGDYIQWNSSGVDRFAKPVKVLAVREGFAFVAETKTGLPMSELTVTDPPPQHENTDRPANPYFRVVNNEDSEGLVREETHLDEGSVRLYWPDNLSAESVDDFEYWVNGLIRKAKRRAGMP